VKSATALPLQRASAPLREVALTLSALGELGSLLDPLRRPASAIVARLPAPGATRPARDANLPARGPAASPPPAATATLAQLESVPRPWGPQLILAVRRPANLAFLIALIVVVSAWWVELRPTSYLGGPASFITVKGTSMLPTLKTGDFVLAEAQSSYHVGNLVVYKVPKGWPGAGADLIHRIVGGNAASGFVLKGDNNPHPDPWVVPRSDIVGKEALVIPGGGNVMLVLRSPLFAGLAAALIAMWVVLSPPEWLRPRKPAAAAAEATPSAGAAGTGHSAAELAPVEEPVPAAAAPEPAAPVAATSPARRRSRPAAKPAVPTARPTTRARSAGRTRAPRQEP
jgi:signal peptidase